MNGSLKKNEGARDVSEYSYHLAERIETLESNMRIYIAWSSIILLLGLAATFFFFKWMPSDQNRTQITDLLKLGPAFISAGIISFPMKDFLSCRIKIKSCRGLKHSFDKCTDGSPDSTLVDAFTELMKSYVKGD